MNSSLITKLYAKSGSSNFAAIKLYLEKCGFVHSVKQINVVGTNGKGSVASFIAKTLQKEGYKVGLFTSPHIFSPCERIKFNGVDISEEEFILLAKSHSDFDGSFFEVLYIMAMLYFQKNNCDYIVLEAGIGGRLDCTNAYFGNYGVVTSIGLDHTEILGNTKEEIALEKAGIMNKDMTFFMPSNINNKIQQIFINNSKKIRNKLIIINTNADDYYKNNQSISNQVTSFILEKYINYNFKPLFGRTTVVDYRNKRVILDGAHNLHGMKATLLHLKKVNINFDQVVISLSKEKNDKKMEKLFKNKKKYLYKYKSKRAKPLSKYNIKGEIIENFEKINLAKSSTLFIGSFHLVEEVAYYLKKKHVLEFD